MTETIPEGLPPYAKYAWLGKRKNEDEPTSKLNTRKVIQGATELIGKEGLDNLTIRRLAEHLGVTPMAVYRHVASREELLILMMDAGLGEPPAAIGEAATWQQALREWGFALFERFKINPWVLDLMTPGLPTTPHQIAWIEIFLKAMKDCRLTLQQKMDAVLLIDGHVRNFATFMRQDQAEKIAASVAAATGWLPQVLDPAKYPNFLKVLQEGLLEDETGPEVSFGLETIIAGLEARMEVISKVREIRGKVRK